LEIFYLTGDGVVEPDWHPDEVFSKVPYPEVPGVYASCDILLKLSSQESFALPVLEMFATGGTAVVTSFTGYDLYIRDNVNALVVPIDDKRAAVSALQRLVNDPALLTRLKDGAIQTCQGFSWAASNDTFEAALVKELARVNSETPGTNHHATRQIRSVQNAAWIVNRRLRFEKIQYRAKSVLRRVARKLTGK